MSGPDGWLDQGFGAASLGRDTRRVNRRVDNRPVVSNAFERFGFGPAVAVPLVPGVLLLKCPGASAIAA